jgi:hypothetical protein
MKDAPISALSPAFLSTARATLVRAEFRPFDFLTVASTERPPYPSCVSIFERHRRFLSAAFVSHPPAATRSCRDTHVSCFF